MVKRQIATKVAKITPDIFHRMKVIERKREIAKVKVDIDNDTYMQIRPTGYRGTHSFMVKKEPSIIRKIIIGLQQLLP